MSGSSLLAVVRHGMWGLLLFAGVAWLAIGWSVLRLEPSNIAAVAGPVIIFGALTEALRACAHTRTWWLNAGLSVLFLATGVVLWSAPDSSYTTPAALVGWYLMVRGALDIVVAKLTRDSDRAWGLVMVVGVLQTGLGFFAASPLARTADLIVVTVGALGVLRAVADMATGLRLWDSRPPRADLLELSPERALGLTGYSAGMTDYEAVPSRGSAARHRATAGASAGAGTASGSASAGMSTAAGSASAGASAAVGASAQQDASFHPATFDVVHPEDGGTERGGFAVDAGGAMWPSGSAAGTGGGGTVASAVAGGVTAAGGMAAAGYTAADSPERPADTFHNEVLRTTADLDAMLALAGVTGAGVGAHLDEYDGPAVPDTPEKAGSLDAQLPTEEQLVEAAGRLAAAEAGSAPHLPHDESLPLLDPAARAAQSATAPGMDETAIIAGGLRRPH